MTSLVAWVVLVVRRDRVIEVMPMGSPPLSTLLAAHTVEMSSFWILMVLGMMLPSALGPIWHISDRSFTNRKLRSVAVFCLAYLVPWMVLGLALIPLMDSRMKTTLSFALVLGFAISWQFSPFKQRCLNRCHAFPSLRAFGWAADQDLIRFGFEHGLACIGSCCALMIVAMAFPTGRLIGVCVATLWIFAEKLERPQKPRWQFRVPRKFARIVLFNIGAVVQQLAWSRI
jgi:predicted metal-binding membrane protein